MVHKKPRGRPKKDLTVRQEDRHSLVEVAHALMREGGATALTARAVAERAGTAIGSVYTLFESLEALKLEANAITMRALRLHLTEALSACGAPPSRVADRLLCLAEAYREFASANHSLWAAMFDRRTIETPPAIAQDIGALFSIIEEVLGGIEGLDPARIPIVAKALWSSVHGMVYLGEVGGLGPVGPGDLPAMIETLVRAAVSGLSDQSDVTRSPR